MIRYMIAMMFIASATAYTMDHRAPTTASAPAAPFTPIKTTPQPQVCPSQEKAHQEGRMGGIQYQVPANTPARRRLNFDNA